MQHSQMNEGTVAFWLEHNHSDWVTNRNFYRFPEIRTGDIRVRPMKYPDGRIVIKSSVGSHEALEFVVRSASSSRAPSGKSGVHIAITWAPGTVTLYVNGEVAEERKPN